jgi:hypothetical protein
MGKPQRPPPRLVAAVRKTLRMVLREAPTQIWYQITTARKVCPFPVHLATGPMAALSRRRPLRNS